MKKPTPRSTRRKSRPYRRRPIPRTSRTPQLEELPDHPTSRTLQQQAIRQMHTQMGNQAIQRAVRTRRAPAGLVQRSLQTQQAPVGLVQRSLQAQQAPAGLVQRGFFDFVEEAGDAVGDVVEAGADMAGDVVETGSDLVGGAVEAGSEMAGDAAEGIADMSGDAIEEIGSTLGGPMGAVGGVVNETISTTGQAMDDVASRGGQLVGGAVDTVGSAAGRGTRAVGGLANRGIDAISGAAAQGANWVTDRAGRVGSTIGRGARRVGSAIGRGARRGARAVGRGLRRGAALVGRGARRAVNWVTDATRRALNTGRAILVPVIQFVSDTLGEAGRAVVSSLVNLPQRLMRVAVTLIDGLRGAASFIPGAIGALVNGGLDGLADYLYERALAGGTWALTLVAQVFDVLGGPDALQFILRLANNATPLTGAEMAAANSIFGPGAIDFGNVRIAEGPILDLVFSLNEGRAFTAWNTICMPSSGDHSRSNTSIVMHELMHVRQYQDMGTVYMGQAIHAQMTVGYGYGGADGLRRDREEGRNFADYNREQQGQIVQDYHTLTAAGRNTDPWDRCIQDLRRGIL